MHRFPTHAILIPALLAALLAGCSGASFEEKRDAAIELYKNGEFQEAADRLFELSREGRADFETRYYLGRSYEELGDYEAALEEWDAVLKIRPVFAEAHYRRGNCLVTLNRRDEALEAWKAALRIRPEYVEAAFNCAVTYDQLKQYDDAVLMYTRAIMVDSTFVPAQHNLGRLLQLAGEWELALDRFRAVLRLEPDNDSAAMNVIRALIELGRGDEAREAIDEYIAERKPSPLELDSLDAYRSRIGTRIRTR